MRKKPPTLALALVLLVTTCLPPTAWAPNKNVSLTLAWVDLGRIVPAVNSKRQSGAYVSAQLAF